MCSSDSGVVNVYSTSDISAANAGAPRTAAALLSAAALRPKPLRALMSLTTPVDSITFNHDAQVGGRCLPEAASRARRLG
jgi:U3 small nucleolar RNA-associated protein 18